jgi:nicotinate-nucleotide adenylyltransferase
MIFLNNKYFIFTVFIPVNKPPHKQCHNLVSAAHRLAMIDGAIEGDLRFGLSDIEVEREGVSYAVDTMRELKYMYPDSDLSFIIGSDSLPELHLWKNVYELLGLCEIKVFERPGYRIESLAKKLELREPWPSKLVENTVSGHMIDISSSDIRYRICEGMSIRYLVHPAVEMYISEHSLYE